jgi:hypothetical protein
MKGFGVATGSNQADSNLLFGHFGSLSALGAY